MIKESNMYHGCKDIQAAYQRMYEHLEDESYLKIRMSGSNFYIPENKYSNWFDDFITFICDRVHDAEHDIVQHCIEHEIKLFSRAKIKRPKK